jgi:hypothetical protein
LESTTHLEEYLRTAAVLGETGPIQGGGAHPNKVRLLLEGGVQVIAKPTIAGQPDSERMMRREAAAWAVAKAMGFTGLVGATVIRTVPHDHGDVEASVQVFWPDGNLSARRSASSRRRTSGTRLSLTRSSHTATTTGTTG